MSVFNALRSVVELLGRAIPRLRPAWTWLLYGLRFRRFGRNSKIFGAARIFLGKGVCIGDFCWLEAVTNYAGKRYEPELVFGDGVAISDLTHISCVQRIVIGNDCLLGSKIYIGDHSHGSVSDRTEILHVPPSKRALGDIGDIYIGDKTWIGDGAVILAGSHIAPSSIIAANSVVRMKELRPALLAGVPAKVIRYFDEQQD